VESLDPQLFNGPRPFPATLPQKEAKYENTERGSRKFLCVLSSI